MKKETSVFDFGHNYEPADILERVKAKNKGKPKYNFLDGPITANAPMCLHHGWGRTLKDAYNRYNSLIGKEVTIKIPKDSSDPNSKEQNITGKVTEASFEDGSGKVKINGEYYSIANIVAVRDKSLEDS